MKKLLVAALAFAVTPALFSVTCTITDDSRVPVGDTPLQYEHTRTAFDLNCARTNKDIPADLKEFADKYKLNSSSDFTIAAAKKAIATKEAITAQANALAKKLTSLAHVLQKQHRAK